jgi:hypothetical protein
MKGTVNPKTILIISVSVILLGLGALGFFSGENNQETEEYVLPEIFYCGHSREINPDRLSRISFVEEGMCSVFGGEIFASEDDAKAKYGVRIDLAQKETLPKILAITNYSAYPGEKVKVGDKEIKVLNVNANSAQFEVGNAAGTILVGQSDTFNNFKIGLKFACGITYRADFSVTEYVCCPPEEESVSRWFIETVEAAAEDEEDEMTKKAREQTEEDLKITGRSGYKGVILPKQVAQDYPSTDFAVLPFVANPDELCCGCRQEHKNLSGWGDYLHNQIIIEVLKTIRGLNKERGVNEQNPYTLVERSESGMRFVLREINYTEQNKEYFDPATRVPKGKWINPDYVIDGGVEFSCCEDSKLVKVIFLARFINAKTEKVIREEKFASDQCFDLVEEPGKLMAAIDEFAKKVGETTKSSFAKKSK